MKKNKNSKTRSRRTKKTRPNPTQGKVKNSQLLPKRQIDQLRPSAMSLNSQQISTYPGGMSLWEYRRASTPGGVRIKGREAGGTLLATITTAVGAFQTLEVSNTQGIDTNLPMHPFYLARLQQFAEVFEHYKFHEFIVDIVPYKPTSTAGVYFGSVDMQGSDLSGVYASQSAFLNGIVNFLSSIYSIGRMIYTGNFAALARYAMSEIVDVNGEAGTALAIQGKTRFGCQGVNTTDAESLGTLVITYDVEFFEPCTPETAVPPGLFRLSRKDMFIRQMRALDPPHHYAEDESLTKVANKLLQKVKDPKFLPDLEKRVIREIEEELLLESKSDLSKNDPSSETDLKKKFDPSCSDGDIPNICHFAGFTGTYLSNSTLSAVSRLQKKESYLKENHHLQLGDGKRFYVCPDTDNVPIDLLSTDRVGIPDPFVIPSLDTTLLGASPAYYPSIKRINFCPCGCNDPRHEEGVPGETICVYCGNDDGHVPTSDWVDEFQCHLAALDPRCALRSMSIDDFYKCCAAIWSVVDFSSQDCWKFYLDFLASPLCENYPCKGEGKETLDCNCTYQYGHLCCLSPSSLTALMMILSSKDPRAFTTIRASSVKVQELVKTLKSDEKLSANPDFQRKQLEYLFKRQVKSFFSRRQVLPVFDSPANEDVTQYGHAFERSFRPPEDLSLCRSSD